MERKKYYYNALSNRLQTFPDTVHFKMFIGHCLIHQIGQSAQLYEIIKKYYAENFTQSERDYLIKKFDEDMILKLLRGWQKIRQRGFTPAQINFMYEKIKFKKVMRLNIGFNEVDFNWPEMLKAFDVIFTGADRQQLNTAVLNMNDELRVNLCTLYDTVHEIKRRLRV